MSDPGIAPDAYGRKAGRSIRRIVNDSVAEVAERLDDEGGSVFEFICECGDLSCGGRVKMTLADYSTHEPGSVVAHD